MSPLNELARDLGFCCLWAFFKGNSKVKTGRMADECGVSKQTIKYHRKRLRSGALHCDNCKGCVKAAPRRRL